MFLRAANNRITRRLWDSWKYVTTLGDHKTTGGNFTKRCYMDKLLEEIDRGKRMLRLVVKQYGLTSPEALRYSVHLDKLIVQWQRLLN